MPKPETGGYSRTAAALVLVIGPAGTGKTRTLRGAADDGDTVDVSLAVAAATRHRRLYVGATRGRQENRLLVVNDHADLAHDVLEEVLTTDRADMPAVAQRRHLARQQPALGTPERPRTRSPNAGAVARARHRNRTLSPDVSNTVNEMASTYSGRLELTWTNKDMRLLAHEDGRYEWVPATDYRVAETRLLHSVVTVGQVGPDATRSTDNLLIRGDALHGLTSLLDLPEFARTYAGMVRLCYIDPPFNTGQLFHGHYDDGLEHSVWLTMLRDRLLQIKRLLSSNGSVWVHLDDREVHRARCVLDELFGPENFVATVMWKRRNDPRNTAVHLSADHDFLLVYAADIRELQFNKLARTEEMDAAYTNPGDDPRGPWRRSDLAARNYYSKGLYPVTTPSGRVIDGPPSGSYWRVAEEELKRLDADGRIYWGADGASRPYLKRFLGEVSSGRVASTIWPPEEVGFVRNGKEEVRALVGDVFATPKPERLMARVLDLASDPGDVVLDCFLGSGTTAAVAHKLGRRWVGIEWSADTVATFALPRLTKVVNGGDWGGVTEAAGWEGGDGFRVLDVAPSMFEDDAGRVVLADWATNGALGEATAAQLGFDYVEEPPFCGRKGRTRLAVVDGLVGKEVIRVLAGALGDDERAVVCGTAIDPAARAVLKQLRPGSTMRKIPGSILEEYRQQRRAQSQLAQALDWAEALELIEPGSEMEAATNA